jgi:type II secretory pathway pseudopilin PulG
MKKSAYNLSRPRRGIFLADTMIGFAILAILSIVVVTGIVQSRKSQERLADNVRTIRMARRVMTILQDGGAAPVRIDDAEVSVHPAPGGQDVPGHAWVEVQVQKAGRTAKLVGLVPRKGAP